MRAGRQDHIDVRHAIRHSDCDADYKYVLSRQRLLHTILVWMDDKRVVVVDEQGLDGGVKTVIKQQSTYIQNVDRPRLRRDEIRTSQFFYRLWKGMTCATDQATARDTELACQCWQSGDRSEPRAAILIALKSVPPGNDRWRGLLVPAGQGTDVVEIDRTSVV